MYRTEVQLSPKLQDGQMQYYGHIFIVDEGGNKITVKHVWRDCPMRASVALIQLAREMKVV